MNLEKQIAKERAAITALDAALDSKRASHLKSLLCFATHLLDDAQNSIQHASSAHPKYLAMFTDFAESNLKRAGQLRHDVQGAVDARGGPENITEIGE